MPALGMAQETGKVLRWLKVEGDRVVKGEPLLEIETDKVTVEIEAPADGTLAGVSAAEGDEVPVGRAIAFVLAAGESVPEDTAPAPVTAAPVSGNGEVAPVTIGDSRARRALASPKARRIAAEHGSRPRRRDGFRPERRYRRRGRRARCGGSGDELALADDGRADDGRLADDAALLSAPRRRRIPASGVAEATTPASPTPTCS